MDDRYTVETGSPLPLSLCGSPPESLAGRQSSGRATGAEARSRPLPSHPMIATSMLPTDEFAIRVAEAIRAACVEAALAAYDDAGVRGLCVEGRWEAAISAIQDLDCDTALRCRLEGPPAGGTHNHGGTE